MSRSATQELDLRIQFSLVSKIRQAATAYNGAAANSSSEALQEYLLALESLADYIAAKWRGERAISESTAARPPQEIRRKATARQESTARVVSFGEPTGAETPWPLNAA